MNVLLVGGEGFLGRHLGAWLAAEGHRVVSVDVRAPSAGVRAVYGGAGTTALASYAGVDEVVRPFGDARMCPRPDSPLGIDALGPDAAYTELRQLSGREAQADNVVACGFEGEVAVVRADAREWLPGFTPYNPGRRGTFKPDRIYHLASIASPPKYKADPAACMLAGSDLTHKLVHLAHASGARLLLASSSEVYGDPQLVPTPEGYRGWVNPVGPRAMYDESKRYAEAYVHTVGRGALGVDTRIARIFNTYGTGQSLHDGRVVPELVRAYYEGRPLPVHGDGQQTRSFCYVSDMVRGLIALMERGGDNGQPVNLGSTHEISMLDLATTVLSVGSELDRPVPNATTRTCTPLFFS